MSNSDLNLFSTIIQTLAERGQLGASAKPDLDIDQFWKFREDAKVAADLREIEVANIQRDHEIRIMRMERAQRIVDSVFTRLGQVKENGDSQNGFSSMLMESRAGFLQELVRGARFDYIGVNLDPMFEMLEFVLTHKNPLLVYEIVEWFITNQVTPINQQETAAGKYAEMQRVTGLDYPPQIKAVIDSYLIYMATQKSILDATEFGYFAGQPSAPASDDAPKSDGATPDIEVRAAPVQSAQNQDK